MLSIDMQTIRNMAPSTEEHEKTKEETKMVVDMVEKEKEVKENEEKPIEELNKKRQYKKIMKNADKRKDWEIDEKRTLPKGSDAENSYFLYLALHPGVFKLVCPVIVQFLQTEYSIQLRSGKPDRFGEATIKNVTYFNFTADGGEKVLILNFYPTTSAIDIRLKGNIQESSAKFVDKGYKTAPGFFVQEIMPNLMRKIGDNNDIEKSKLFWKDLAEKGYNIEKKKDMKPKSSKVKPKCDHCNKQVGTKVALQCHSCSNLNLIECLSNLETGRIEDFRVGNDTFICNKCIPHVDVDTLNAPKPIEQVTDEDVDEVVEPNHMENLRKTLKENVEDFNDLNKKYQLLAITYNEIKNKTHPDISHEPCNEKIARLEKENELLNDNIISLKEEIDSKDKQKANDDDKNQIIIDTFEEEREKIVKENDLLKKKLEQSKHLDPAVTTIDKPEGIFSEDIKKENEMLKEEKEKMQAESQVKENELAKYKEFLARTQEQCKHLETLIKKDKEIHEKEKKEIIGKKVEAEERYGRLIKEKKCLQEKERILLNTFDALKRLQDIKITDSNENRDNAIDITGEEEAGGSSSKVFECDECVYKTSMKERLTQHKKDKHTANKTMKDTKKANKTTKTSVQIPCDVCDFSSISASDFLNHIKTHEKPEENTCIPCDLCDYNAPSIEIFKSHIGNAHKNNQQQNNLKSDFRGNSVVKHSPPNTGRFNKFDRLCLHWNRGRCKYPDNECRFRHEEIPPCRFQGRCNRNDCRYFHERSTGRFPFLASPPLVHNRRWQQSAPSQPQNWWMDY